MKRYWLFIYAAYYPYGGMRDFTKDYDTIEEASKDFPTIPNNNEQDSYHLFDSVDKVIITGHQYQGTKNYHNTTLENM